MDSQKILIPDKHIPRKKPLKSDRDILEELLKKIDQMQISNDQIKESQQKMEQQLIHMEKQLTSKEEIISRLETNEVSMREEINELKQRSRLGNIIIKGLVETKGENILKIVTDLGNHIGIKNAAADIQACQRVPTHDKNITRPIAVRLLNSKTRDE